MRDADGHLVADLRGVSLRRIHTATADATTLNPMIAQFNILARIVRRALAGGSVGEGLRREWPSPGWLAEPDGAGDPASAARRRFGPMMGRKSALLAILLFTVAWSRGVPQRRGRFRTRTAWPGAGAVSAVVYFMGMVLDGHAEEHGRGGAGR